MRRSIGFFSLVVALAGCAARRPPERWLLSYDGTWERQAPGAEFYRRALSGPAGRECDHSMFTGVIFLGLREATNGRWFAAWMNTDRSNDASFEDWLAYIDTLTSTRGPFSRLAAGGGTVSGRKLAVAVMIPAVARGARALGSGAGPVPVVTRVERERLYGAYIDTLRARFARGGYSRLDLDGVYWLDEAVWGGSGASDDPAPAIAAAHARGLRILWIPYFGAGGAERWKEMGFDAAWQQPNYFFDARLSRARLDTALRRADAAGMGLELELDKRLAFDSAARRRLRESVATVGRAGNRNLAVYDGAGALNELFTSSDPALRETAADVARLLCSR